MLPFTGERFVPGSPDAKGEMWYEHWHRYHYVLPLVTGKVVLDVACGEGYGSALLSRQAARVSGVDISAEAIAHGRGAYADRANLELFEAPCTHLPFAAASFDAVFTSFSFCTVADPQAALRELDRVLTPGGRLLMLEHVHLPWQPGRRLQSWAAPAWAAVAGGCRLDRDTGRLVREAGFAVLRERSHVLGWIVELEARSPVGLQRPPISR